MSSLSDEPPKTQDRTFQAQYFRPWDISRGVTLIPNRWLRYKGLALTAKLVYWVMARFSHGKTYCFVKAKTIARELCLNRSTVIEAQRQLVEKRFLQRQRRGQGRSIYHFLRHPILDHTFPDEADDAEHGESDHDGNVTDAQPPSATVRNATTIPLQSSEIQKSGNPSSRNRNPQLREVGSAECPP